MISAEKIPNNVNLSSNKRLQRALEHWQPKYIQWWRDMGPQGFQDYHQVYVRTAISVDPEGWAHFEYVKLPDYRWGIFLAEPDPDRRPQVPLVVVLEPLRAHLAPPLQVLRLPVLERPLQPLVVREVDVIRDLLGGNHGASLHLVIGSSGYLVIGLVNRAIQ